MARRGLCGDVYLASTPPGPRISDVKVDTSVRKWRISFDVALEGLANDSKYVLRANVTDGKRTVLEFTSEPFQEDELKDGRITFTEHWKPEKLWDIHTPQNMYHLHLSLLEADGEVLDAGLPVRFGFREFWIDGRDFYLNGTRIFLSSVPLDNAQVGAAWATYDAARESMQRLKSFGINFVYTHNYGCEPGSHLSFEEILRAADDVGMLVAFSQPHFGHYDWDRPTPTRRTATPGTRRSTCRVAQNHPSVVAYSTSHNATGYTEDMNPDMIDGIQARRSEWSARNVKRARRAEAIIKASTPAASSTTTPRATWARCTRATSTRTSSPSRRCPTGSSTGRPRASSRCSLASTACPCLGLDDVPRLVPRPPGVRQRRVPWEFCLAEWNAQFLGDQAYRISEAEKANLRWEAEQFRAGRRWHRWDYPHPVGSSDFTERYPVYAMYFTDNWPAFRTWGVSANSPWDHGHYWTLRDGVRQGPRRSSQVDWQNLQRPGFSPDYIEERYERIDLAFERSDWIPTVAAEALIRNNRPLLAYIAGKPGAFTSKDHNFFPGETVEKQLIVINNSRETVTCDCQWSFGLPEAVDGHKRDHRGDGPAGAHPAAIRAAGESGSRHV